jgi:SAM-dependent methyltransferase
MSKGGQEHWQGVYSVKAETEVSWFQESPEPSLGLILEAAPSRSAAIVDIGGGASRLAETLIGKGFETVSVLDLSAAALDAARSRMTDPDRVRWIVADATQWQPDRPYHVWHDRAALHFLTDPTDQTRYAERVRQALAPGGVAVIGTFAPDGPEKCSGLPVYRHDSASLAKLLGAGFSLMKSLRHDHVTPWGSMQKFQFSIFRKDVK